MSKGDAAIAVLGSAVRADERRLLDALDRRGISHSWIDSRQLSFPLRPSPAAGGSTARRGWFPWRCVLNREIGQVRAAYAAKALEAGGALVLNHSACIDVCGDKWRTSLALAAAGLPVPRTALALTPEAGLAALEEIGYPALIKPLVGSWGRLIVELRDAAMARGVLEYVAALPGPQSHLVYVQELVAKPGRDIRAIVLDGELLGAIYRIADDVRTNVARGAVAVPCPQTPELAKLAIEAAAAVGAEIAAVDLVEDEAGNLLVLEVNHRVEFTGFQRAMGDQIDVADRVVELLISRVSQ